MKQAVRLMRITVSIATPVLLGYAIGTFLILMFLEWLDSLRSGNAMSHLYFRYQFSGFDDYFYTVHPSFIVTIMSCVVYTSFVCSILMLWPTQIAYPGRLVGSRMTRRRVNLLWHAALWRHQPIFGLTSILLGLAVGVGASVLSLMIDPWITTVRTEMDIVGVMSGSIEPTPRPVLGWFSYIDGIGIVIGVAALAYWRTVWRANRIIRRLPIVRRNWCARCAYPLDYNLNCDREVRRFGRAKCPECGLDLSGFDQ